MKIKQVAPIIARAVATGLVAFWIGGYELLKKYDYYWNTTIYRVQTVDFNLLSHSLPTKLSYEIIRNKPEELQRTLDSNFSLFGLVVTDPSGKKIIASSGQGSQKRRSWDKVLSDPQELQKQPYDFLLDPPPLYAEGKYQDPYVRERSVTGFKNKGLTIGRVYYVRGIPPDFSQDLTQWINNGFIGSGRYNLYSQTVATWLGAWLLVWLLAEFFYYRRWIQEQTLKNNEEILIQQNKALNLQLQERINTIEAFRIKQEQAQLEAASHVSKLSNHNQELRQKIAALEETLPKQQVSLAQELARHEDEVRFSRQEQQKQRKHIHQLEEQLKNYQTQLEAKEKQQVESTLLEKQINKIKDALLDAQLELVQASQGEKNYQKNVVDLERKLEKLEKDAQEQLIQQQKILMQSELKEQEAQRKAAEAEEQNEVLRNEISLLKEEMGKHPLNPHEIAIQNQLKMEFPDKKLFVQFDVGNSKGASKTTDFILAMNNCLIVIEAKSYMGTIKAEGDPYNTSWLCEKDGKTILINSCWGSNPYEQVKTYAHSLLSRFKFFNKSKRFPIYGIIVFSSEAEISDSLSSAFGRYYYVVALEKLPKLIDTIEKRSLSLNTSRLLYSQILERLTCEHFHQAA